MTDILLRNTGDGKVVLEYGKEQLVFPAEDGPEIATLLDEKWSKCDTCDNREKCPWCDQCLDCGCDCCPECGNEDTCEFCGGCIGCECDGQCSDEDDDE